MGYKTGFLAATCLWVNVHNRRMTLSPKVYKLEMPPCPPTPTHKHKKKCAFRAKNE
jgi:hypothetical protein